MKSKKEQILLKLQKKFYNWNFKFNFVSDPLIGITQIPTSKGDCSKPFDAWKKHSFLGTTPFVQQAHFKKIVVATRSWLLPLAQTPPIPDKVRVWSKRGKISRPGADRNNPLWECHRYKPSQKKHSAILFMLRIHLKQLKKFLLSIKNVLQAVLLPCIVPTYFLKPSLGTTLLPHDRISGSHMLCMGYGSVMGVKDNNNTTYGSLSWVFVQKRVIPTATCPATLVPLTGTTGLGPVGTKKSTSSPGSRVSKGSLPKVRNNKKNNSPKGEKVIYTQEDLVKKTSHFINIWCYLQMIFFFFHTLKQPMVVLDYPHLGCRAVNSLTFTTYSLLPTGCFLIWVTKFGYYPWRRQLQKVFVPTGFFATYAITWGPVTGVKVEVLALSFLPQFKLGYLKDWLLSLEERVSKANLPRVREASLSSSRSKKKSSVGMFCKQKGLSFQTNHFYKYLGFCDYIVFKMVWKWFSRKHSNQSAQWIRCHYFYKLNGQSWVFALKKILFNPNVWATGRRSRR